MSEAEIDYPATVEALRHTINQLQRENDELKAQADLDISFILQYQREVDELKVMVNELRSLPIFGWLSAALEDDKVCSEMKRDIHYAFNRISEAQFQSLADHDMRVAEKVRGRFLKEVTLIIQSIQVRTLDDGALDEEDSIRESAVFDVEDSLRSIDLSEVIKDE